MEQEFKRHYFNSIFLFLSIVIFLFVSCKKEKAICTGNCFHLKLKGRVINGLTKKNEPNIPLRIEQVKFQSSFYSTSKIVQDFSSDDGGRFDMFTSIDSTIFGQGYFLSIKVRENQDFMTLFDRGYNTRVYDINTNTFDGITLTVYPKVYLKIKLNRTQTDNFQYFGIAYFFVQNEDFFPYSALSPESVHKTEIIVPTSADVFTKIRVSKRDSKGMSTMTVDSIKCTKGGLNTYTINY